MLHIAESGAENIKIKDAGVDFISALLLPSQQFDSGTFGSMPAPRWQALPQGRDAAIIGSIGAGRAHVVLETEPGSERMLEELEDDPLPRIC